MLLSIRINENEILLTQLTARITASRSPWPPRHLHNTVHVFKYKSAKFHSLMYNTTEDIWNKLNRKPIFTLALYLSKCNDQISNPLCTENCTKRSSQTANFPFNGEINIEGILCNLSSVYAGCSVDNSGSETRAGSRLKHENTCWIAHFNSYDPRDFTRTERKQKHSSKMNSNKESSSSAEKMKKWREKKIEKKKEADRKYYERNRRWRDTAVSTVKTKPTSG